MDPVDLDQQFYFALRQQKLSKKVKSYHNLSFHDLKTLSFLTVHIFTFYIASTLKYPLVFFTKCITEKNEILCDDILNQLFLIQR